MRKTFKYVSYVPSPRDLDKSQAFFCGPFEESEIVEEIITHNGSTWIQNSMMVVLETQQERLKRYFHSTGFSYKPEMNDVVRSNKKPLTSN